MSVDWRLLGGLCLLLVVVAVNGELYTALAEMEELLETESVLITNLEGYIRVQEDKLSLLKNADKETSPRECRLRLRLLLPFDSFQPSSDRIGAEQKQKQEQMFLFSVSGLMERAKRNAQQQALYGCLGRAPLYVYYE
ncbi:GL13460 [Drosophila persimilis]|uniref:GL13460 n=1 Tax=Drosophila persimilis TaxID=7234 RepID=B4GNL9_DROPE|nr:GL13460 [Drosophila persimilis]